MASSCPCCSRERDSFVCRGCLTKLLKLYKSQASSHNSLLPAAQARALSGIKLAEKTRQLEARHVTTDKRIESIRAECMRLQASVEEGRTRAKQGRQALAARRSHMDSVKEALGIAADKEHIQVVSARHEVLLPSLNAFKKQLDQQQQRLSEVGEELANTRQILLHALLEAFEVTERADPGAENQIASLAAPPLPQLLNSPKQQFNAILSSLFVLIRLVARYLGLQVPFPLLGSPSRPLIHALPKSLNSYKYPKVYPLYMSSATSSSNPLSSMKSSSASPATSTTPVATPASHAAALKTGVHMLAFDIYYLYQSSQDLPRSALISTTAEVHPGIRIDIHDMISLLVHASRSGSVGRLSHLKALKQNTLRNVESLPDYFDFPSYVQLAEEKEQARRYPTSSSQSKRKGTYVVVAAADDISPGLGDISTGQHGASKDAEGWDLV